MKKQRKSSNICDLLTSWRRWISFGTPWRTFCSATFVELISFVHMTAWGCVGETATRTRQETTWSTLLYSSINGRKLVTVSQELGLDHPVYFVFCEMKGKMKHWFWLTQNVFKSTSLMDRLRVRSLRGFVLWSGSGSRPPQQMSKSQSFQFTSPLFLVFRSSLTGTCWSLNKASRASVWSCGYGGCTTRFLCECCESILQQGRPGRWSIESHNGRCRQSDKWRITRIHQNMNTRTVL